MVTILAELRAKVSPNEDLQPRGLLVVPATAESLEEFLAEEEARTRNAPDPATYVNHKAEEMGKAVMGLYTPLGSAVLKMHHRWGC